MKKLKLRIVKFDRMLVVEQLEKTGEWKNSEHVKVDGDLYLFDDRIDLQENIGDRSVSWIKFNDNAERDEYTQKLIDWIAEEQFGDTTKLEIGKHCLVRDHEAEEWEERIYAGKVPVQLGLDKRYLVCSESEEDKDAFFCWRYAKLDDCLKIDGEIYTWETK